MNVLCFAQGMALVPTVPGVVDMFVVSAVTETAGVPRDDAFLLCLGYLLCLEGRVAGVHGVPMHHILCIYSWYHCI